MRKLSILSLIFSLFFSLQALAADWKLHAKDLGNEELRQEAISELRDIKALEFQLVKNFNDPTQFKLALQVIEALNLTSLLPELWKKLPEDVDGRILDLIFTLSEIKKSKPDLEKLKSLWEKADELSNSHKIIFLSRFSSSEYPLLDLQFQKWIQSDDYGLRIALSEREINDSKNGKANLERWKILLATKPYQVRWELLASLPEMPSLPHEIRSEIEKNCAKETRNEVKGLCEFSEKGNSK